MFFMNETERKYPFRFFNSFVMLLLLANVAACGKGNEDQLINTQGSNNYTIRESGKTISYDVGGTVDESSFLWPSLPSNGRFVSSVMIRNTGDTEVVNPRVSINGHQIPLTTEELLNSITPDSQDDLDRLLKIFYAIDRYSIHENLYLEQWQDSPLTFFVGYGGGLCEDRANVQRMLWDYLGYQSGNSQASNHTAYDVEYGNRVMHLDPDTAAYYLRHDNWTGASSQDIFDDPMLVQRAVHYRNYLKYPVSANSPEPVMWYSSEKVAAFYGEDYREDRFLREPVYEEFNIVLRPGEGYGWNSDKPKYVHPIFRDGDFSHVLRDFTWESRLNFSKASNQWPVQKAGEAGAPVRESTVLIDKNTKIVLSYAHPFPMTGADLRLYPGSNVPPNSMVQLTITGKEGEQETVDVPLNALTSGQYPLSSTIQKLAFPLHTLQIEIGVSNAGPAGNNAILLEGLWFRLYSQGTSFAFPSLKAGRNDLVYSDASDKRSVEVQVDAVPVQTTLSGFPGGAIFAPRDNALVAEAALTFSWPKIDGTDVRGYQIQISAFADMRYPLSPTFERMIDKSDVTESQGRILYTLPWRGMLPVNRNLYWRVRPYRGDLLAGQWSGVFPFKVKGPQAPEGIKVTYDQGKVILSWSASPSGTLPAYYEIHSSVLEGFSPMSEPYRILGFGAREEAKYEWYDVTATDWPVAPETTLTTTKETRLTLFDASGEKAAWFSKLGAHFRVIAVDADGSRSCPSPQAHLQSPLITLPDTLELTTGAVTLQVPVISTVGRITVQPVYFLGLWNKPVLKYSLSSPNGKWSIDEDLGVIKGTLSPREEVSLAVAVEDQFDNKASRQIRIKAK